MTTDKTPATLADAVDGWPEHLMIRDTGLADDMGGLGQRIFTTAGAGYIKKKYIREDLAIHATLATAKHGGCVQIMPSDAARTFLAAQYRDDGDKAKAIRINHKSLSDSDRRALRAIEAALSAQPSQAAQAAHCPVKHCGMTYARVPADGRCHACGASVKPSPGGQGDARRQWLEIRGLAAGIVKNLKAFAESPHKAAWCGTLDDSLSFADQIEKNADAAYAAALAARQPVGETAPWRYNSAAVDSKALATATEIALMWGKDRSQFVSRIQAAVIDAMQWMNGGLLEKPAQAVDLGEFRASVLHAYEEIHDGYHSEKLGSLLALIDSQAVGK